MTDRFVIFDLDGTLLDSDEALVTPYLTLGVDPAEITYGHVVADECIRLGIDLEDYLDEYDPNRARPFAGVTDLLAGLDHWAVCSNKHPRSGRAELARLGWEPSPALFADAFEGPKQLVPVLDDLGITGEQSLFVGDTDHDRDCARAVGARFVLAGWNPRADPRPGDLVASTPIEVLALRH